MLKLETRSDLQRLIDDDIQESATLDYKDAAALGSSNQQRSELFKDVSAFANSAGGQGPIARSFHSDTAKARTSEQSVLTLLWQIYSGRRSLQIHFRQCGHRCGGSRAKSSRMAWRTAGK